jgi:hypothetical protein
MVRLKEQWECFRLSKKIKVVQLRSFQKKIRKKVRKSKKNLSFRYDLNKNK